MKTLTVTEVARNFRSVMDDLEARGEEVVLVRNRKVIARLIPEPAGGDAMEVFGDLYRTLDDATAGALAEAVGEVRKPGKGTLDELRNPWVS